MSIKKNQLQLKAELLESREVPASMAYLADAGHTLIIRGDNEADDIKIVDNRGSLAVSGIKGKPSVIYSTQRIDTVAINLRGGNDRFEYVTSGDVLNAKQLRLDLGDGDDTGIIRWAEDRSIAKAGLTAVVYGGNGNDAIGARIGQLSAGVSISIRGFGGAGDDALQTQSFAPAPKSKLDVALRGGDGNDTVGFIATGDSASSSWANFDIAGDAGDDLIDSEIAGKISGKLTIRADGGIGNDMITSVSTNSGVPSKVNARLIGGEGDDQFAVLATKSTSNILVDGGNGSDVGTLTETVQNRNLEASQVPSNYERAAGPATPFYSVLPTSILTQNGRAIEYYTAGKSAPNEPVVVLLTGFGGTIDYWQTVPGALASKSQVIAVNRPGYGRSAVATGDYATTTIEDIQAVVKAIAGNRPVILVGHSLGGLYANLFARLHPDEVAGVVFVDATAPEVVLRIDAMGYPNSGLGDASDPAYRLQQPGILQEVLSVVETSQAIVAQSTFPEVPVISLRAGPTDLLADDPEGNAWYEALGSLGGQGETRRIVDSGHNLQFDRPDAVNQAVTDLKKIIKDQGTPAERALKTALESARTEFNLPAMAGGIIVEGKVVATASTGVRERGNPTAVTADDQFHLGSNGKAMTSTLAGILVERKLIQWNTTIAQAFPELRGKIDPAYARVTLEQLLNHRGGFIDENLDDALIEKLISFSGNGYQARQKFLGEILKTPAGKVGEFSYSNAGYTIASAMMERLTGNNYEWLMKKYIFNPLGMTSAGFGVPGKPGANPDQPRGHDPDTGLSVGIGPGAELPAIAEAAGEIHMSMADWGKFLRVHLGEKVNGVKLLSDATLQKLHTPDPRPTDGPDSLYGFGWVTIDTPLGKALWHNGSNGFWYSEAILIPSQKIATFAVTNQAGESGMNGVPSVIATLQQSLLKIENLA
jgi:CubicO group peptidase (beta-lactamase class C family)/pimeloyl-ACP methyl ester carboxylesterase